MDFRVRRSGQSKAHISRGPARRVWYIRRAPLILTLVASFFFGSIVSEFVQGMLPVRALTTLECRASANGSQWKDFQWGDILVFLFRDDQQIATNGD